MTLSKFLTYWSLLFAILTIWGFSVLVALASAKDELLDAFRKRWATGVSARLAFTDPLAGRSTAETLTARPVTELQKWVLDQVAPIAERLGVRVRTLVLQDGHGHFVVYLAQGKRLVTYRLDKAWVTDAVAGKADQLDRIRQAVEQYLRQEFLGQAPVPKAPPAAPSPPAAATAGGVASATPAPASASAGTAPAGVTEVSREERIAAAKAKAEALKSQRAASAGAQSQSVPPEKT
ncbi:MAG TPA: hypothetical protein VKZ50_00280 [bacterium]|nr:hypothetical protein [bacterium]